MRTAAKLPPLQNGDRLNREEFERRFDATREMRKAELINGVVYIPTPFALHGTCTFELITWLGNYRFASSAVRGGCHCSLRIDGLNEPQPDVCLLIQPELGGQAKIDEEGYIAGGPELVAEVAASSASYDLHDKLDVYRRSGVQEYIVWRVFDRSVDWFVLRGGRYEPLPPSADGLYRSEVFPGLWLDPAALLRGDLAAALQALQQGLASLEHAAFVGQLAARKRP